MHCTHVYYVEGGSLGKCRDDATKMCRTCNSALYCEKHSSRCQYAGHDVVDFVSDRPFTGKCHTCGRDLDSNDKCGYCDREWEAL